MIYCSENVERIRVWNGQSVSVTKNEKKRKEENGMNSEWRRHVRILPERKRYNEKRRVK